MFWNTVIYKQKKKKENANSFHAAKSEVTLYCFMFVMVDSSFLDFLSSWMFCHNTLILFIYFENVPVYILFFDFS